ncbi:MAG: hypothetical protein J6S16_00565, partial [Bacteroidales bacterium]|nr:hypothetical protein [Bacteroidales bacterium]
SVRGSEPQNGHETMRFRARFSFPNHFWHRITTFHARLMCAHIQPPLCHKTSKKRHSDIPPDIIGGRSPTFTPEYPFSDTIGGKLPIFAPESLIFTHSGTAA